MAEDGPEWSLIAIGARSPPERTKEMASPDSNDRKNRKRRHRGLSISFDTTEAQWVDALVDLLKQGGYPKAGRSEVVRVGLLELREALSGRSRSDIVKYFAQRDADRLVADLDASTRHLPST